MAILSKMLDNEVVVVDDLAMSEIKTKQVCALLKTLQLNETTCLIGYEKGVDEAQQKANYNLYLSARNLPSVQVTPATQFNVYTLLRQKRLVLSKAALEELRQAGKKSEAAAG